MEDKSVNNKFAVKNLKPRYILDKYYSVQFSINGYDPVYMFKLRDFSYNGLCILVKEDSDVLKRLKVNETLNMEYNPSLPQESSKFLKTRINDITKDHCGGFSGHRLVELSIIDEYDDRS